jgi:DDE family transposase
MSILQESYDFLQQRIVPKISLRHRKLFLFGFEALTIKPFVSLNGNARTTIQGRKTAESKIYRIVHQEKFLEYFPKLPVHLGLVTEKDVVNVDFSTFGGFYALTFARQTALGRALPLYFATITYPIASEGSQTIFIEETITAFIAMLGFRPHLVFDRGFESPHLVPFLVKEQIPFTMRFKKDKHVLYQMKEIPMRNLPWFEKDCIVTVYEKTNLRIIVSEKLSERKDSEGKEEPWYLITNDLTTEKEAVIGRYYFRFEIEETFKDLKHINDLSTFYRIKKEQTFKILLWFCILSVWLSFLLERTKHYLVNRVTQKKNKLLSITRYFSESIQLELFTSYKQQFL